MTTTAQLRELLAKATPGPLVYDGELRAAHAHESDRGIVDYIYDKDDGELIAAAINALPTLLKLAEAANNATHHWQRACQAEPGAGRIADNAMVKLTEALREFEGDGK